MTYQYTDSTQRIVMDGNGWSGLASIPEVQAWVAAGNTIAPASSVDWRSQVFAQLDAMKTPVYNALAGYGFTALATGDTATASAIAQVQIGLRGLKTLPAVVAATNEADLKAALMAGFRDVVSKAPPSVLSAFVGASL